MASARMAIVMKVFMVLCVDELIALEMFFTVFYTEFDLRTFVIVLFFVIFSNNNTL